MLSKKFFYEGILLLAILILISCTGHKRLNVNETYYKLTPIALLPEAVSEKHK